jgi:hypothetical protein
VKGHGYFTGRQPAGCEVRILVGASPARVRMFPDRSTLLYLFSPVVKEESYFIQHDSRIAAPAEVLHCQEGSVSFIPLYSWQLRPRTLFARSPVSS